MTTTSGQTQAGDLDRAARRVDTAVERAELLDPAGRKVALDLKAAMEEFHRDALVRIVRALKADPRGKELLFELVDDPVVYALLAMHGIVRADPTSLAERALAEVRPYLDSHGGGVSLVGIELPVARVRLTGACTGCSQSAGTLREVVERAIVAAVPGVQQVQVVPSEPEPALVPLSSVGLRPGAGPATVAPPHGDPAAGWTAGPALDDVADGRVTVWRPPDTPAQDPGIALVRIGQRISAFRDACAHAGMSLERGLLDSEGCVLTCPWHGMKYQALTGECMSMPDTRLQPYPARVADGVVWLRLTR